MKYVVYCDESRHDGPHNHRYMAIGSLWAQSDSKETITKSLRNLKKTTGLLGEAKWTKVNHTRLEDYKRFVDLFGAEPALQYRVIVVDQSRVDLTRHDGDAELGFYKFYYELLEKWMDAGDEYLVLLDFKQNAGSGRYSDLRRILSKHAAKSGAKLLDLTVIDSSQSPLAQVCDVLTGATAAACCGDLKEPSAKALLVKHIESVTGVSLRSHTPSPAKCKFNIFRIDLR